ncbi:nitroreductase family protein [Stenotrophomonas sp.]|uniref:nitroreductase family protein n=1 Tax=Stenotrophomonas sp. TaxID=69392 RepID=UPI0028A23E14|nr:nitroreductase family protein [Stenotrophomonas sp.]
MQTQQQILSARYGQQPVPDMLWNDQIAALVSHRTARAYLPDAVPAGALEAMVAAAQSASTSSNHHQWSVVAVSEPALKAELSALAQGSAGQGNPHMHEAPVLLLWVADLSRNAAIAAETGTPNIVHGHLDAFLMASVDAALASQNAVVAAESLGLAVCYIGGMRNSAAEVAQLLGLPSLSYVVFGMTLGYPDPQRLSEYTPRPQQAVVLHHNCYDANAAARALETYDQAFDGMREALAGRFGIHLKTWREGVRGSVQAAYMDGRENLRQAVQGRGFELK